MLKKPNPTWFKNLKKLAVVCFAAEGLCFAGSYYFWYRLNTNRDFRHYCHLNYPSLLEGYYKIGEFFDSADSIAQIRRTDLTVWAAIDKPTEQK